MRSIYDDVEGQLQSLHDDDLYRSRIPLQGAQGPVIKVDDAELLNFSSNDYLGLANDDRIKTWLCDAIAEYGAGAGASQLIVGHSARHRELEQTLSAWLRRDRALVFSSGYLANLAIASSLIDKATVIFQDKLNHASLIDAAQLSRGRLVRYPHNDMDALHTQLEKYKERKLLVMTDGVFSMDGDCARLQEMADLCADYHALLIVDDAHGIGVLGQHGGGLLEQLDLTQEQVPLLIGTFGKSFGMTGAFIAGHERLLELILQRARTYIYTTALLPAVAAALVPAVALVADATDSRRRVSDNIKLLKTALKDRLPSETHIQPIIIGDAGKTLAASERLYEQGVLAMAIRPPTVPAGTARLRLSISAAHETAHMQKLVTALQTTLH